MHSLRKKIVDARAGGWDAGREIEEHGCNRPQDPETVSLA
jgi:hypothetical protein